MVVPSERDKRHELFEKAKGTEIKNLSSEKKMIILYERMTVINLDNQAFNYTDKYIPTLYLSQINSHNMYKRLVLAYNNIYNNKLTNRDIDFLINYYQKVHAATDKLENIQDIVHYLKKFENILEILKQLY